MPKIMFAGSVASTPARPIFSVGRSRITNRFESRQQAESAGLDVLFQSDSRQLCEDESEWLNTTERYAPTQGVTLTSPFTGMELEIDPVNEFTEAK